MSDWRTVEAGRALLKQVWMRLFVDIEKTAYQDDCRRLERAYAVEDPWHLSSAREALRYKAMSEMILEHCGRLRSLLEIGSGEGHHTQFLEAVADEVVGLEVSEKAIARARKRCLHAKFVRGHFPDLPDEIRHRFDLVVASEVLYYIRDLDAAVDMMNQCGTFCLASCYAREIERIHAAVSHLPMLAQKDLRFDSMSYRVYLWRSGH
jgi:SAM-dependent methyltransferase